MSDLLNLTQWESHPLYDAPFVAHYQSPWGGKDDPRRRTSKAFSDPSKNIKPNCIYQTFLWYWM